MRICYASANAGTDKHRVLTPCSSQLIHTVNGQLSWDSPVSCSVNLRTSGSVYAISSQCSFSAEVQGAFRYAEIKPVLMKLQRKRIIDDRHLESLSYLLLLYCNFHCFKGRNHEDDTRKFFPFNVIFSTPRFHHCRFSYSKRKNRMSVKLWYQNREESSPLE